MTSTTLTDRYVWAATRSVPEGQRTDLERELRERIGDATDALVQTGRTTADAERNRSNPYIVNVSDPKVEKLKKLYPGCVRRKKK